MFKFLIYLILFMGCGNYSSNNGHSHHYPSSTRREFYYDRTEVPKPAGGFRKNGPRKEIRVQKISIAKLLSGGISTESLRRNGLLPLDSKLT